MPIFDGKRIYEFILKIKEDHSWVVKYKTCCPSNEEVYKSCFSKYKSYADLDKNNRLLLINELSLEGEFVSVIQ